MQRGYVGFPFSTGRQPGNAGSVPPGLTTIQGNGTMKSSVIVFNTTPGTYSFIVPRGVFKIRVFVVGGSGYCSAAGGAGAGYSEKVFDVFPGQTFTYTVGSGGTVSVQNGGTSTFSGVISATGSTANGGAPGVGSGGDINSTGGAGPGGVGSGGSSGHRFGNGSPGLLASSTGQSAGGAGWVAPGTNGSGGTAGSGGAAGVDGFGLGLIPAKGGPTGVPGDYGSGGGTNAPGGLGAGAGSSFPSSTAGGGAIGGAGSLGGNGGVGVEVIG